MFQNVDQLEKELDKEEFQETGSIDAFRVLKTQFQHFIHSWFCFDDDDGQMTSKYFLEYTRIEDTSSGSRNDADADTADIKPVYDEEPMDEVAEQCHDKRPLLASLTDNKTTELSNQSLESDNIFLKKTFALFQKDFSKLEAHCIDLELQLQNNVLKSGQHGQFLKEKSNEAKENYGSNDMIHHYYLEHARKKTQERGRNSRPSVMPSARSQCIANGSKPKPRIINQKSRNSPASKNSCVTTKTVPIAEHSRNSRNFSDSKYFVCSTCQKCVFNANHDACVTKFLNRVNSRAKVPSHKITTRYKPVEQISIAKKPERQIPTGHSSNLAPPRQMTSIDNNTSGLAPQLQKTFDHNRSELRNHYHINEPSSLKLVLNVSPLADKTDSSQQELDFLFSPLFEEYFTARNQSVSNPFTLSDNSTQQDTQPTTNVQPTT
ncbi:hypothetical protein Tco_1083077 [Tanacetum coccineum]|uniref:Uncharacterized protein n=1 Tax=Tanacetum coccineum TaxID=301880 RepID=A0ABQ5I280_9ASTR